MYSFGFLVSFLVMVAFASSVTTRPGLTEPFAPSSPDTPMGAHHDNVDLMTSPHQYTSPTSLEDAGEFPSAVTTPLLADTYPMNKRNSVSDAEYKDVWTKYPQFSVNSTQPITNNIRYPSSPEIGKAVPSEFNKTFYKSENMGNNYVEPMPAAPLISPNSVRINYYVTPVNLFMAPRAGPQLSMF